MFLNHHLPYTIDRERPLRPDRRPFPQSNEIRMRIRRALSRREA